MTSGHIHTDRSRERRANNSGKSDDSTYPKTKTPSREDTVTLTSFKIDDDIKKVFDVYNEAAKKSREERKNNKSKRNLVPPERKKKRQGQLSEDTSLMFQNIPKTEPDKYSVTSDDSMWEHSRKQLTRSVSITDMTACPEEEISQPYNIKRSISITLPNKLNHKIRRRANTVVVDAGQLNQEFRVRSSSRHKMSEFEKPEKTKHTRKTGATESQITSKQSGLANTGRRNMSESRKKYLSCHDGDHDVIAQEREASLQDLLSHFTEIEKRNRRANRERHISLNSRNLPGLDDLLRRHEDLKNVNLLHYIKESRAKEELLRKERRSKNTECVISQIVPDEVVPKRRHRRKQHRIEVTGCEAKIEGKVKRKGSRHDKTLKEILENRFDSMQLDSVYNSPAPNNVCKPGRNSPTATPSQSESEFQEIEKDPVEPRKPNNDNKFKFVRMTTRQSPKINAVKPMKKVHELCIQNVRPSRSHTIEHTKKATEEQTPRPRKTHKMVVDMKPSEMEIGIKVQRQKPRTRLCTREEPTECSMRHECKRHNERPEKQNKAEQITKPPQASLVEAEVDREVESSEDGTLDNNSLVKNLKKIDKQNLKKRLSLDKLDSLDTDDESHLDRMLGEISAFVEDKLKRRRYKTNGGIRYGPSTVHVYDPMVSEPFLDRQDLTIPRGILKKRS